MMTQGFVANGATVYICSRKEKVCKQAAEELTKTGPGKCIAMSSFDLSKGKAECTRLIEELKTTHGSPPLDSIPKKTLL